jgi:hypothetical protein
MPAEETQIDHETKPSSNPEEEFYFASSHICQWHIYKIIQTSRQDAQR